MIKKITETSVLLPRNRNRKLFQAPRTFPNVHFLRLKQILKQILCILKSAITKWRTSHNKINVIKINSLCEAAQTFAFSELTRLTQKIAIPRNLAAESHTTRGFSFLRFIHVHMHHVNPLNTELNSICQ